MNRQMSGSNTSKKPAVVLLSGGLDSATALAIACSQGFTPYAMSFRYGQQHDVELEAASQVAQAHGVPEHRVVEIDLRAFGGSALTDSIEVPKDRTTDAMTDGIPVTYVPARNTIFLSYALAWAEVLGAFDIFCGVNAVARIGGRRSASRLMQVSAASEDNKSAQIFFFPDLGILKDRIFASKSGSVFLSALTLGSISDTCRMIMRDDDAKRAWHL